VATKSRNVRVDDGPWLAARSKASQLDTTRGTLINLWIRAWLDDRLVILPAGAQQEARGQDAAGSRFTPGTA
jgi:hypothetical protein